MKKADCYYYRIGGYCDKALFTPCEFKGCVAYIDHKPMTLAERKEEWLGKVEEHRKDLLKLALTADDIRQIIHIHREVLFEYSNRIMNSQENFEETLRRFNQWKEEHR